MVTKVAVSEASSKVANLTEKNPHTPVKPLAIQGHTLNWRCQFDKEFFWKPIQFNNFISELNWIESKSDDIITMSIHFDNFLIISHFYTFYVTGRALSSNR